MMACFARQLGLCAVMAALTSLPVIAQTFDGKDIGVFKPGSGPGGGTRLAVVVGIDEYEKSSDLPTLRLAEKDAKDVASILRKSGFKVTLMVPSAKPRPLTAGAILDRVDRIATLADPPDTLLFYFSGHGFSSADRKSYVCAYMTDPSRLAATALSLEEVSRRLKASSAKKRMMIVDACRNIPGARSTSRRLLLDEFRRAEGTGYLFSTAPGFRSYEPATGVVDTAGHPIRNGLFTHFLLRGLAGDADRSKDRFVTFRESSYFVARSLKEWSTTGSQLQKPYLLWDGGAGDDILLRELAPGDGFSTAPARAARPQFAGMRFKGKNAGGLDEYVHEKTGTVLVRIPGGVFRMGSERSTASADEKPTRGVRLSPYFIAETEVTNAQYARFCRETGRQAPEDLELPGMAKYLTRFPNHPVVNVSWNDAQAYAKWAELDLPTEAQWEFACRAGTTTTFCAGNTKADLSKVGWFNENSNKRPHTVGAKSPNSFGLYDMHGNVWEWTADGVSSYDAAKFAAGSGAHTPHAGEHGLRINRGGSFWHIARNARSSNRDSKPDRCHLWRLGFRISRRIR